MLPKVSANIGQLPPVILIELLYLFTEESVKTLQELRLEFEKMAQRCMFYLDRMDNGEYHKMTTFHLWAGYWECAVKNNIIGGDDALIENINK